MRGGDTSRRQRQTYAKYAPRLQQFEMGRNRPNRDNPAPPDAKPAKPAQSATHYPPACAGRFEGTAAAVRDSAPDGAIAGAYD